MRSSRGSEVDKTRRTPSFSSWLRSKNLKRSQLSPQQFYPLLREYRTLHHKTPEKMLTPMPQKSYIVPRSPIRSRSKAGDKTEAARRKAKKVYFRLHSDGIFAPCQVCGHPMERWQADAMHKRKASLGKRELDGKGGNDPKNFIIGHGHKLGAIHCHGWADETPDRVREMTESPVNVLTGGRVEWSKQSEESLSQRLSEAARPSRLQWVKSSGRSGTHAS